MTDRAALSAAFLHHAGWGSASRCFLAGDASERSYDRLSRDGQSAVLMDAPPARGDDTATFVAIARHLAALGLSPPAIFAEDHVNGFLLLEDLGDDLFARLLSADPGRELALYTSAADVLVILQRQPAPPGLPDLSAADWADAAAFALDWYAFAATGTAPDRTAFVSVLSDLMARHADGRRVMILRDYHAENLLWLPARHGAARVGLLDFQLAQMGQPGYDLVSLLQDARRDVDPQTESRVIAHFCAATGTDPAAFATSYATLGAQRALRILGIFARLCLVSGKPAYLTLIPRVWNQLQRNLSHPALGPLAAVCRDILPEPTTTTIERIRARCGQHAPR